MNNKCACFLLLLYLLFPFSAVAAEYFVCDTGSTCGSGWFTGNDSGACTTKDAPCKTIKGGIGKMSAFDTLIVGNGTYTGSGNNIASASDPTGSYDLTHLSGSSTSNVTTFKCENHLGCIIDMSGDLSGISPTISYARFENFHVRDAHFAIYFGSTSHYNTVINCATEEAVSWHIGFDGDYNLSEGNISWGMGTYYQFVGSHGSYNVFRRNVVRRDAHYMPLGCGGNNYASFAVYNGGFNNYFFSNISLDSEYHNVTGSTCTLYNQSTFYTANGGSYFVVYGGVSVNNEVDIDVLFESNAANCSVEHSAFLAKPSVATNGVLAWQGAFTNSVYKDYDIQYDYGGGIGLYGGSATIKNNVLWSNHYGLDNIASGNTYNSLYGNDANWRNTSQGTGEFSNVNPATGGILYPVRVEGGSTLKTACESSGQCGPSILYQMGRSESHHGETGWNLLQDGTVGESTEYLWPWPNENTIKTKMAAYNAHGVTGARGFCTGTSLDGTAQTLTKYIWEYLGNQIPADIYGGDTTPPTISGCSFSNAVLH